MTKQEARANGSLINLAERIDNLTSKRQEIIRPILEHPREYVLLSVRSMAQRLKTDPATIVRIVRGLGFATYRDFQHHLHELSIAFASPLDSMLSTPGDSSIPAIIQESLARSAKNLQALKNSLDATRLAKVAKRLFEARRIVAFAADSASILAEYLEYHLSILGLPIVAVTTAGGMTHLARVVRKRDVVIAISFQRGLRQTVEGAEQAKAHGAYCIGISDTYLSPLARICDDLFLAAVEAPSFGRSYTAPISLLDAMIATCGQYRRPMTMAVAKEIAEEQRKGVRWYNP
ncbi:MAG TPA: MurR/RpiR family transcriptional regulator [Candidatus Acidoferrum sp.]|jgi:DNA-binding MurR/RpiR family transcriptional regulator